MAVDSDMSVSGTLLTSNLSVTGTLLTSNLSLKNATIDHVTFNSNAAMPSISLLAGSNFHTIGVTYDSNQGLGGCNIVNIGISGTSAVVVDTFGNMGMNTRIPLALFDIVGRASNTSNIMLIRDSTLASIITVDNHCRLGVGTSNPAYKLHVYDCNIANSVPNPIIGIDVSASPLMPCAPIIAAFSNSIPVLQVAGTGNMMLGSNTYDSNYMLNVAGAILTTSLVTSAIGSVSDSSTIDFQTSILSNIQTVSSSNIIIEDGTATTFFADSLSTSNLVLPNVTMTSTTTNFSNANTLFDGQLTIGSSYDDSTLSQAPYDSRRVLIAVSDVTDNTVVALGVVGNNAGQGRNVIRIAANYPAFELYSTASSAFYQKLVQGVDANGYYMSYDTTSSRDLTTQRQIQLSQYGMRICNSLQIPFTTTTVVTTAGTKTSKAGNVGINLPTLANAQPTLPFYPLHVDGAVWIQSANVDSSTTLHRPCFFVNDANCRVGIRTDNPQTDFHVDGTVYVQSIETLSPPITSSDRRLKEDITPIIDALNKVQQLTGYTYMRKTDSKEGDKARIRTRETGLLAQEVQAVLPEAVTKSAITRGLGQNETDYLGVAYGNMAGLFVEAIKEMSRRIDTLQAEVDAFKTQKQQLPSN